MVEFAVTLLLFLIILMAIFEFVIMIMAFSRANEATREIARTAIISDPIYATVPEGEEGEEGEDEFGLDCDVGFESDLTSDHPTATRLLDRARVHLPAVTGTEILVRYECADGASGPIMVTALIQNRTHRLLLPDLLKLPAQIPVPSFSTSRVGESLETLNRPD